MSTEASPRFTLSQRLVLAVVPPLVWALLRALSCTWRFEVIAQEGVTPVDYGERSPAGIFCFWHQCVLPAALYFRHSRAVILVSRSFDGELITRIVRILGYDVVRGSSSRGGREGLAGLKHTVENGKTAIFAADGPRGPIYQSKMGPIKLAQITGAPIGSFYLLPERAWKLSSWDRFLVPKPFTRICLSWAQWTHVPMDLPQEDFEAKREELNAALERARLRALAYFGKAGE